MTVADLFTMAVLIWAGVWGFAPYVVPSKPRRKTACLAGLAWACCFVAYCWQSGLVRGLW